MKIGLQIPYFKWPGGTSEISSRLKEIAATAEDAGFDSLWVMDHFFQIGGVGPVEDPMLEAYTTLGYMAAATTRVTLGTLVTGAIYRYPGILVKTATTLDVLSGGRAYFGIGAGWFEREALALGAPFPSMKDRFERLEETLQIAHQMWSDKVEPYHGKHFQLEETLSSPQPIQKPHPPILIGGGGEQKTLRMVAQYGDACNLMLFPGADVVRHKLDVLKRHCETLGRPYEDIERTALGGFLFENSKVDTQTALQTARITADLTIQHLIITGLPDGYALNIIKTIGRELIPAIHEM